MKVLTPWDVALRMMRHGRDPGLIVAYLEEEASRAGFEDNPLRLSQHPQDRFRFAWQGIRDAFRPLADMVARFRPILAALENDDEYTLAGGAQ